MTIIEYLEREIARAEADAGGLRGYYIRDPYYDKTASRSSLLAVFLLAPLNP